MELQDSQELLEEQEMRVLQVSVANKVPRDPLEVQVCPVRRVSKV